MITLPLELAREVAAGLRSLKLSESSLPALRCVRVGAAAGRLVLQATTLDEWLIHTSPTSCTETADFLLPAERLLDAVKSADPKTEITLSHAKSGWEIGHRVGGQLFAFPLSGIAASEFPDAPAFPEAGQPVPAGFTRTLEEAMAAAGTDASHFILNSVLLTRSDVVATDGRQLFASNSLNLDVPARGIILRTTSAIRVFDAGTPAELVIDAVREPRHAGLRQGAWLWVSKLIDGNYPNWKQVVPRAELLPTELGISNSDAARLQRMLPRLPGASEKDAPVVLTVAPGASEIRAGKTGAEIGVALTDSTATGPAVTTAFNRGFLLQALSQGFRTLRIHDNTTPVVMRGGARTYLWMPVRSAPKADAPAPPQPVETVPPPPAQPAEATPPPPAPEPQSDPNALSALQRARELLRDLQGALSGASNAVRVLEREKREVERDLDALKRNLRALKSVEV